MFNLGFFELLLFGVIALIVLGPDKLIYAAKTLGKWYGQFRRISDKLQQDFASEFELNQLQKQFETEIAKIRASEQDLKNRLNQLQNDLQDGSKQTLQTVELTNNKKAPFFKNIYKFESDFSNEIDYLYSTLNSIDVLNFSNSITQKVHYGLSYLDPKTPIETQLKLLDTLKNVEIQHYLFLDYKKIFQHQFDDYILEVLSNK